MLLISLISSTILRKFIIILLLPICHFIPVFYLYLYGSPHFMDLYLPSMTLLPLDKNLYLLNIFYFKTLDSFSADNLFFQPTTSPLFSYLTSFFLWCFPLLFLYMPSFNFIAIEFTTFHPLYSKIWNAPLEIIALL